MPEIDNVETEMACVYLLRAAIFGWWGPLRWAPKAGVRAQEDDVARQHQAGQAVLLHGEGLQRPRVFAQGLHGVPLHVKEAPRVRLQEDHVLVVLS